MISQVNPLVKSKVYLLVNISKLHKLQTQFLSKSPCPQSRGRSAPSRFAPSHLRSPSARKQAGGRRVGAPLPIRAVPVCAPLRASGVGGCKRGGGALPGLHASQGGTASGFACSPRFACPFVHKGGGATSRSPVCVSPLGGHPALTRFGVLFDERGWKGGQKRGGVPFPRRLCAQTGG